MGKEHFFHGGSRELVRLLDTAAQRGRTSRSQAFDDFLHMTVCALSGGRMEDQYLATVKRYADGEKGKRGADTLAQMFGRLIELMDETRADILGDVFQGAITYGDNGQFFTPDSICTLMAKMTMNEDDHGKRILDPCCGSGRMLLACAAVNRNNEFHGQDVDLRCVRMTAINLALRNLYGCVVWGDALTLEQRLAYRTGFNGRGFIREVSANKLSSATPTPQPTLLPAMALPLAPVEGETITLPTQGMIQGTLFAMD